jgi:hypothetical protein
LSTHPCPWDSLSAGEINPMVMLNPALMVKFPMNIYEFQSAPDFLVEFLNFPIPHG